MAKRAAEDRQAAAEAETARAAAKARKESMTDEERAERARIVAT